MQEVGGRLTERYMLQSIKAEVYETINTSNDVRSM
jgi:hypothetical protein